MIQAHTYGGDQKVTVNEAQICYMISRRGYTTVFFHGERTLEVNESVGELLALIEKAKKESDGD